MAVLSELVISLAAWHCIVNSFLVRATEPSCLHPEGTVWMSVNQASPAYVKAWSMYPKKSEIKTKTLHVYEI